MKQLFNQFKCWVFNISRYETLTTIKLDTGLTLEHVRDNYRGVIIINLKNK